MNKEEEKKKEKEKEYLRVNSPKPPSNSPCVQPTRTTALFNGTQLTMYSLPACVCVCARVCVCVCVCAHDSPGEFKSWEEPETYSPSNPRAEMA